MLVETRRKLLLDLISRRGFATLEDLVETVGFSESTVRRDLEALDGSGVIKRTHGGAVYAGDLRGMPALDDRRATAAEEKQAIGLAAAALVRDGDTVLLDGGTTTLEVARALVGRSVQVVTNSLPIAQLLTPQKDVDLILIGGYVYPRTGVALGPIAIACMESIRVHLVIMGAGGVVAGGVYNSNSILVETERQMMRCGQEVMLVVDHTKFGKQALTRLCGLEEIGRMVIDDRVSKEDRAMLKASGVAIEVATTQKTNGTAASSTAMTTTTTMTTRSRA